MSLPRDSDNPKRCWTTEVKVVWCRRWRDSAATAADRITNALPLLLEGSSVAPEQQLKLGIVHRVLAADQLVAQRARLVVAHQEAVSALGCQRLSLYPAGSADWQPMDELFQAGTPVAKSTMRNYPRRHDCCRGVRSTMLPMDAACRSIRRYFATCSRPVAETHANHVLIKGRRLN